MPKWLEKLAVPVLVAVISIGGTFLVTNYFKEKKSLGYQVLTKTSLVDVSPEIKDRIKVTLDGRELQNFYSFKVRFLNDGNVPLEDFTIYFEFDKKTEIISSIDSMVPEEFDKIPQRSDDSENRVHYFIPLLNPHKLGEEIFFNFLTKNNSSDTIIISSRGTGFRVHVYDPLKAQKTTERIASVSFVICIFLFMIVDEIDRWHARRKKVSPKIIRQLMWLFTTILLLSGALFLFSVFFLK